LSNVAPPPLPSPAPHPTGTLTCPDALQRSRFPFFETLGDLIRTGPTGTNVNDILFFMVFAK
jgi:hypothetical protein